ncbi:hypothetical protein PENTCL1PPCAC_9192, partial [Pristionchus entomophagus]
GHVMSCRRCRFDLIDGILKRANLEVIPTIKSEPNIDSDKAESIVPASLFSQETQSYVQIDPLRFYSDSSSISFTPVLDRIRCGYNVMIRIR